MPKTGARFIRSQNLMNKQIVTASQFMIKLLSYFFIRIDRKSEIYDTTKILMI